ncbi:hypothetical protein ACFVUS_36925 [Nocardia sp. NPDC058058]|uniref:hypothetical protein n=1 Tax=Nocardia sp. NPDC058058 TaxID=3346317 RepID=UPI0036DD406B
MKRAIAAGLLATAALAVSAAPAQAEGPATIGNVGTGSTETIHCDDGTRVQFLGTGSAVLDLGANVLGLLYDGAVGTGSTDNSSQVPCNTTRRGLDALLTSLYRSGSAG